VQEWLGHESLATTQKYLEPSKETEKQLEDLKLPFKLLRFLYNETP
jgi:site-specific recombinase XerD